jgi:uncharacterized protein YutE (UPF0331/DUF86 family)
VTLRHLARLPREQLINDPVPLGSAERYLQVAIEACLDIANHIIAAERLRPPKDYADVFSVLQEADLIPAEFLPALQRMARFRNRLVHLYWDVDAETIYEILQARLDDFDRFKGHILAFLTNQGRV